MNGEELSKYRLDQLEKNTERFFIHLAKQGDRITVLERWRYILTGGFLTLSSVVAWYAALRPSK